jgi:23S rRNA pseudouridine1911/1915/1917 synthase
MKNDFLAQVAIIYEDEQILVVSKPAGMLVHPTVKMETDTLYDFVKKYYQDVHLNFGVHPVSRLDRFTSGLVLFTKEPHLQGILSKPGNLQKEYLAIVTGTLPAAHGLIDAPIARKEGSIIERCLSDSGQPAQTEYWQVAKNEGLTLVRVKLYTGRTHQIRVHFASLGCPLQGDNLYGTPGPQGRHALHAFKLAFKNPVTEKELVLTADLPADLQKVIYPS